LCRRSIVGSGFFPHPIIPSIETNFLSFSARDHPIICESDEGTKLPTTAGDGAITPSFPVQTKRLKISEKRSERCRRSPGSIMPPLVGSLVQGSCPKRRREQRSCSRSLSLLRCPYLCDIKDRSTRRSNIPQLYNSDCYNADLPYWVRSPLTLDGEKDKWDAYDPLLTGKQRP
jgi:hypothetical protein